MARYRAVGLRHEGHGEQPGPAQRVDDEMLCVTRVLSAQKRRNRYGSNRCNIGVGLICNLDFHLSSFIIPPEPFFLDSSMTLIERSYEVDGLRLTGFVADGSRGAKVPGILVAHEAPGVSNHVKSKATVLAERGYLCFVLDMYGRADLSLEEAREQSRILMADAALLRRRARAALEVLAGHPHCDSSRLGAIGFCLGGIVALELARDRAPLRCAVGFHPGLMKPSGSTTATIDAKVLMMIGDDDPVIPSADRASFAQEMKEAGADWQLHVFGGVGHSFTNPDIDALGFPGFSYDERADQRAWNIMLALFDEVFES